MIARTRRRTVSLLCLGVLVLIALVPRDTAAQVLYGSVVGDVKDATGGALPGATLVITSTDRGLSREAVTDAAGHFTFSNLPAGVYELKASQQGFKGFEQKEVTVTINAVTRVDVTLEVGAMGETVTVKAGATEAADRHGRGARHPGRGGAGRMRRCPWAATTSRCTRLLPGFAPPINSHSIPSNPSRSLEFTVNGTSDDQNNTRIDGVSTAQRPAAARLLLRADARGDRGGQRRHQQHGRRAGAGRRSRDQRADQERHQRLPRIRFRVLHQPGPEGLADAVR